MLLAAPVYSQTFAFPAGVVAASGSDTEQVTVQVTSIGSLSSVSVVTQGLAGFDFRDAGGGSCSPGLDYLPGQSCTVNVKFAPIAPGTRQGAVILKASDGTILGSATLSAVAKGAVQTWTPGLMSTAVGSGQWIYVTDGLPANISTLYVPMGVVVDVAGNLYISDTSSNRVRRVDAATSITTTIAGNGDTGLTGDGGLAKFAALSNPTALALDGAGHLYIADNYNNAVRVVDLSTGVITRLAGTGTAGYSGDGGPASLAKLNQPNGLAIDAAANVLYVADTGNSTIRKIDLSTGTISTFAGKGVAGFSGDGGNATAAMLNAPWGVAVGPNGQLCIADQNNHRIRCVTGGVITTIAGNGTTGFSGDGGPASSSTLKYPAGVLFDTGGNLYVADTGNNRIRKIHALTNVIETVVGTGNLSFVGDGGPATGAEIYGPYSMALDGSGSLYLADMFHNIIRKVTMNQTVAKYASIRVGRVSAPQSFTIENDGNDSMTFSSVSAVSNASLDTATTTCTTGLLVTSGKTCVIGASFAPTVIGDTVNGSIEVHSEATNSPAVLAMSGEVLTLDPTTVAVSSSSNPAAVGSTVTFTAKVISTGPTAPTGKVTFFDGNTSLGQVTMGSGSVATLDISTLTLGTHNITASYAGDTANNPSVSPAMVQTMKLATQTSIISSSNPSGIKEQITLTAKVTASQGTASGTIVFKDGATALGAVALDGNGVATLQTNALSAGSHDIVAGYSGDSTNMSSISGVLSQVVNKATTTTLLASADLDVKVGEVVALTATVSGGGLVPVTGSVTFKDGTAILGTVTLDGNGKALYVTASLTGGSHSITAVYGGDDSNATSTSASLTQNVDKIATSTLLAADKPTVDAGAPVLFAATVTPAQTTGGTVTGTVVFKDGAAVLGTVNLPASGVASLSVTSLSVGTHSISASYSGATNFTASQSAPLTQNVQQATTSATLATSGSPSIAGANVTFSITVTGTGAVPTGAVTVKADGIAIGTTTLNGAGKATFATAALAVGSHIVTAEYLGDAKNGAASSAPLTQVINGATTGTVLTVAPSTVVLGKAVAITATVSGNGGVPTGSVTILDGGTTIGTATLNGSGVGQLQITPSVAGQHQFTAVYAGDAKNGASTSNTASLMVMRSSTVTVVSDGSPAIAGKPVQFTASVAIGDGTTATGTVAFKDAGVTIASVPVQAGIAVFSTTGLTVGNHNITVSYSGDTAIAGADSAVLTQVIRSATTTVTLSSSATESLIGNSVTFTARVAGDGGVAGGKVTFLDGAAVIGTANLDASGAASLSLKTLAIGQHSITARYEGDAKNTTSLSAPVALLVRQPSTVAVQSSINPSLTADVINFTVKVSNTDGKPTGTVTLLDGGKVLGTAQVGNGGVTSFSSSALIAGTHQISATYSGDGLNLQSTSDTLLQVVNLRATTTGITASVGTASYGTPVTLVAVIRGIGPSLPTGVVNFTSGSATLGSAKVDANGLATLVVTPEINVYNVMATYSGDTLFAGSASDKVTLNVTQSVRFTMALTPSTISMASGAHTTITLNIASMKGFTDTLHLGCAGLPNATTCTFAQTEVKLAADGTQSVQVTIDTGTPLGAGAQASVRNEGSGVVMAMLFPGGIALGFIAWSMRGRRKMMAALLMIVAMVVLSGGLTGCGTLNVNSTPAGNYQFQLTGTGMTSNATQSATLTMNVGK